MNVYQLNYQVERLSAETGKRERKSVSLELALPSSVHEITLLQWVQYHKLRIAAPPVVTRLETADGQESTGISTEAWTQYISFVAQALAIFSGVDADILLSATTLDDSGKDGIIAMYMSVVKPLLEYQAKDREFFMWKGRRYAVPENVKQSFGVQLIGGKMNVAQAIDALSINHTLGQYGPDGAEMIENQRYHNDIMLTAALCREVYRDGTIEVPSTDFIERRRWLDDRAEVFKDLPMDIALDVAFFLSDLKGKLLNTLSSALLLRTSIAVQQLEKARKQTA